MALRCLHLWGQVRNNPLYEILMMDPLVHHEWAQRIAAGEGMGEEPYFRNYDLGVLGLESPVPTSKSKYFFENLWNGYWSEGPAGGCD